MPQISWTVKSTLAKNRTVGLRIHPRNSHASSEIFNHVDIHAHGRVALVDKADHLQKNQGRTDVGQGFQSPIHLQGTGNNLDIYACMYVCMYVDGWMDGCMCMFVCMYVCMDGWMDGWMDVYVCMYAWMDGWMDGCVYVYVCMYG